jgi:sugar-specific transcriptional regulator TrmB
MSAHKEFDLNIDSILENWNVEHAIRELIANAIDEQILTQSQEIEIKKEGTEWIIKDFGRGLTENSFVLNENVEKLNSDKVIGKFGVGLKDSLAIFYRHGINFKIISKHGIFTISKCNKHGFNDIKTLHVIINENPTKNYVGTTYIFDNLPDSAMDLGKQFFLKYMNENLIDRTTYGDIYERTHDRGTIYMNGIKIADEPDFMFSYNVTKITKK